MSNNIPIVNYWFDVERYVTEFIDNKSYAIQSIVQKFKDKTDDEYIKEVAKWINTSFKYPLNSKLEPATEHEWKYYNVGSTCPLRRILNIIMEKLEYIWARPENYLFNYKWLYVWQDPLMTLRTGYGICIDTALLSTSVLRGRTHIKSYVEAGYVTLPNDHRRYGHAWVSIPEKDILIETTIHDPKRTNITSYQKATTTGINGIKYYPIDRWNESEYESLGSWIQVGGFLLAPKSYNINDIVVWKKKELLKQLRIWRLWWA